MTDLRAYLLVAGTAALATYLLTPLVRRVSLRFGALAQPGDRTVHAVATPTLGGLAMFLGFVVALALASLLPALRALFVTQEALAVAVGASLMLSVGIIDDLRDLSAPAKLAAQVLAAGVMTIGGVQVLFFWLPFADQVVSFSDLGVPITILLVVITANAVNLVDGLDGLAAGLVAIGAAAYFVYSYRSGLSGVIAQNSPAPLLASLLCGTCLGFLPHNFNPARIFMGDSGALMLGTLLAGATVTGIGRTGNPQAGDVGALLVPITIPILVLALPFLDVGSSVLRRVRSGRGVMTADKEHLHHRLLELVGNSHRRAVLLLYGWSALLACAGAALSFTGPTRVLPAFLIVVACGMVAVLAPRWRAARSPRRQPTGEGEG